MGKPKHPCAFCGRKAIRLCDYIITITVDDVISCDTPLCRNCAVMEPGFWFCCSRSHPSKSRVETHDYCPIHDHHNEDFRYPVKPAVRRTPAEFKNQPREIEKWRENHAAAIRRSRIEVV